MAKYIVRVTRKTFVYEDTVFSWYQVNKFYNFHFAEQLSCMMIEFCKIDSRFELMIRELQFVDRLCLVTYYFKQFFVKIANQNFPSVRIFFFRETMKFLFTLPACHLSAYLKL